MKTKLIRFIVMFLLAFASGIAAEAQFVVRIRPAAPVIRVRPVVPSPRHVWVSGEYVWRGDRYDYTDGYWAEPPRGRHHWVEGRWKYKRGGWFWVPGHWR